MKHIILIQTVLIIFFCITISIASMEVTVKITIDQPPIIHKNNEHLLKQMSTTSENVRFLIKLKCPLLYLQKEVPPADFTLLSFHFLK
jgi:hypothetical protein